MKRLSVNMCIKYTCLIVFLHLICGINNISEYSAYGVVLGDDDNAKNSVSAGGDNAAATEPVVDPNSLTESKIAINENSEAKSPENDVETSEDNKSEETTATDLSPTSSDSDESKAAKDGDQSSKADSDEHEASQTSATESQETDPLLPSYDTALSNMSKDVTEDEKAGYKPLQENDSDEDERYLEITEAPEQVVDSILGAGARSIAKPEFVLSVHLEASGTNPKRTRILSLDVVDSDKLTGSYYRIQLQNGPGHLGSFLVDKESGDEIVAYSMLPETPCISISHPNLRGNIDEEMGDESVGGDMAAPDECCIATEIIQIMANQGYTADKEYMANPFRDPSIYVATREVACDCIASEPNQEGDSDEAL